MNSTVIPNFCLKKIPDHFTVWGKLGGAQWSSWVEDIELEIPRGQGSWNFQDRVSESSELYRALQMPLLDSWSVQLSTQCTCGWRSYSRLGKEPTGLEQNVPRVHTRWRGCSRCHQPEWKTFFDGRVVIRKVFFQSLGQIIPIIKLPLS